MNRNPPDTFAEDDADALPDRLPSAIVTALREHDAHARADRAVLADAEAYFAGRQAPHRRITTPSGTAPRAGHREPRRRARQRRFATGIASAAAVLLAVLLVQPVLFAPADPDDIDGSGQVDILDAFALARMRTAGADISDSRIEALARRIVALEPQGASRGASR